MWCLECQYFCTDVSEDPVASIYTEDWGRGFLQNLGTLLVHQATPWYNPGDRNPNICSPENHGSQNWAWYRMVRKWLDRDDESTWANRFSRFVLDFHLNSSSPWLCSGQSVIQMEIGWSKRNIAVEICIRLHRRHWWLQSRVVCQRAVIPPSVGHSVSRDCDNVKSEVFPVESWLSRKCKMKFGIGKIVLTCCNTVVVGRLFGSR